MSVTRLFLAGLSAIAVVAGGSPSPAPARTPLQPTLESARDRAHLIFNAVHSAGRQWGSSLNHNGFGFFPAVMPKGNLLYHGSRLPHPPDGPEWLAFEVEHAQNFARSFYLPRDVPPPPISPQPPKNSSRHDATVIDELQKPLGLRERARKLGGKHVDDGDDDDTPRYFRGYLHTYRANRDLNLLYVDGMSAGKTDMGTLDSQDLILRGNQTSEIMDEWSRATSICDLILSWGYDGFVRNEIGFEVVYCNFTTGVDLVSATRTFMDDRGGHQEDRTVFQWARAVGERYDGLGADRLRIDFSSMVSALFFPVNISSIDPDRPDLLRLAASKCEELKDIKTYLQGMSTQARRFTVNWQGTVDMIVSRYADRLADLGSTLLSDDAFIDELEVATNTYFDAPPSPDDVQLEASEDQNRTADAVQRCIEHYLLSVTFSRGEWAFEDKLIYGAIDSVMQGICVSIYTMRSILLEAAPDHATGGYRINRPRQDEGLTVALNATRAMARDLQEELAWTRWKKQPVCPVDEVPFVAMWPFGEAVDHWNPGCRTIGDLEGWRHGYWSPIRMFPPRNDTDSN